MTRFVLPACPLALWLAFLALVTLSACGDSDSPAGADGARDSGSGGGAGSTPGGGSPGNDSSGGERSGGTSAFGATSPGGESSGGWGNLAGAPGGDAAGGGAPAGGAAGAPEGEELIPVFVAQGHVGRTVLSCDGGRTWVAESSTVQEVRNVPQTDLRCWSENLDPDPDPEATGEPAESFELDCDHQADPGRGIAFGAGSFLATFGWGEPGRVVQSRGGQFWEERLVGTTFGGVAYVQGTWILGARMARRSTDGGLSFEEELDTGLDGWNVRRVGSTDGWGGRVILVGEAGDAVVSSDGGRSFWHPEVFPAGCGAGIQTEGGIVSSDDVWLVIGGDGSVCLSVDGGERWELTSVGESLTSHAVFDGERFMVWSRGMVHASSDGVSWSVTGTEPADLTIGPVAVDSAGRLAAVEGGWNVWYEDQTFYSSDDGVSWREAEVYRGGHPIRAIASGEVLRPMACD